ncbi:MAG: efflux RND transporter periplasmic adaptor subunit [Gammaproteobacteria bacterium]|nr:MAG: efflux RND transporter periplasmic adaptor subunit [Gammaproteobacteria bacterium]
MNRRALLLIFIALIVVVGVLGGYKYWRVTSAIAAGAAFANPAEAVNVAQAHPIRWQVDASAPGTVVAREFVTLSNELPGTVARVEFRSGEIVEAGQVLLELDTRTERADLRSAEADITLARLTAERTRKLIEQRAGTQADADRAEAQLAQAEARRDVIATTIQRRTLRAPFRGRIGLRDVHPGQYLAAGTGLTTLESVSDSVYVDFRMQQEIVAQLAPGAELRLGGSGLPAGTTAIIRAIDARADEATRTVRVRAEAPAAAGLTPGAFVEVTVAATAPREVLAVPLAAVRRAAYGDHVYVIHLDEQDPQQATAEQRFVRTGPTIATEVVILDGLTAGERVATEGSFKLRQGSRVKIVEPAEQPPAPAPAASPGS